LLLKDQILTDKPELLVFQVEHQDRIAYKKNVCGVVDEAGCLQNAERK
jgi:hypothetical protein